MTTTTVHTHERDKAPRWTLVYLGVTAAMALVFSGLGYVNPHLQFGTWEAVDSAGALSLAGPLGLYLSRNVATAVVSLIAAGQRSVIAVTLALLLRAVTDGLDAVHAFAGGGGISGAGVALVMFAVDLAALVAVRRILPSRKATS